MRPPQLPVIRRKSAIELDEHELIRKRHATSQMEAPLAQFLSQRKESYIKRQQDGVGEYANLPSDYNSAERSMRHQSSHQQQSFYNHHHMSV